MHAHQLGASERITDSIQNLETIAALRLCALIFFRSQKFEDLESWVQFPEKWTRNLQNLGSWSNLIKFHSIYAWKKWKKNPFRRWKEKRKPSFMAWGPRSNPHRWRLRRFFMDWGSGIFWVPLRYNIGMWNPSNSGKYIDWSWSLGFPKQKNGRCHVLVGDEPASWNGEHLCFPGLSEAHGPFSEFQR